MYIHTYMSTEEQDHVRARTGNAVPNVVRVKKLNI